MLRRSNRRIHITIINTNNNKRLVRHLCIRRVLQHHKVRTLLGMFPQSLDIRPPCNTTSHRRLAQ